MPSIPQQDSQVVGKQESGTHLPLQSQATPYVHRALEEVRLHNTPPDIRAFLKGDSQRQGARLLSVEAVYRGLLLTRGLQSGRRAAVPFSARLPHAFEGRRRSFHRRKFPSSYATNRDGTRCPPEAAYCKSLS